MLLCSNARTYNEGGSLIYSDSIELENGFLIARAEIESGDEGDAEGGGVDNGEEGGIMSAMIDVVGDMSGNSDGGLVT